MHPSKHRERSKKQLSEMKRHACSGKHPCQKNSAPWLPYYSIRTIPALGVAIRARPPVIVTRRTDNPQFTRPLMYTMVLLFPDRIRFFPHKACENFFLGFA